MFKKCTINKSPDTIKEVFTVDNGTISTRSKTNSLVSYYEPNPQGNFNNYTTMSNLPCINLCTGAYTTGDNVQPYLSVYCADSWNGTNNIVVLACNGWANSGYNNASRLVIDGSYATNSTKYNYGGTVNFQAQSSSGNWVNNVTVENGRVACGLSSIGPTATGTSGYWNLDVTPWCTLPNVIATNVQISLNWINGWYWCGRATIIVTTQFVSLRSDDVNGNVAVGSNFNIINGRMYIPVAFNNGSSVPAGYQLYYKIIG